MTSEPIDYEGLGKYLADTIDTLEAQNKFAGDMECVFSVPLADGSEYEVTVRRKNHDA